MKRKLLLLTLSLTGLAVGTAYAGAADPGLSEKGKKDDLAGLVIHAESKKPMKDVIVTAYLVSKKEQMVQTDEVGNYVFDELKPGTYKFVFEKAGYKKVTKEKVIIRIDEAFQLNIEMVETKDFDLVPSPLHFADF